jgi:hypothetical protein
MTSPIVLALALAASIVALPALGESPPEAAPSASAAGEGAAPEAAPVPAAQPESPPAAEPAPSGEPTPPTAEAAPPAPAATAAGPESATRRAEFLHGDALAAELDGDVTRALACLREAHALDPQSAAIRFDLARLAIQHQGERSDLEAFAAAAADDPASTALRRAVQVELARRTQAERLSLWGGRLRLRATLGTSVDTNANIAPDEAAPFAAGANAPPAPPAAAVEPLLGVRLVHAGEATVRPLSGVFNVDAALGYRLGVYLNSGGTAATGELGALDTNQAWLSVQGRFELDPLLIRLTLSGSELSADGFSRHYLQTGDAQLDLLFGDAGSHFGLYGLAGLRDFVDGNPVGAEDRDARVLQGGFLWTWRGSRPFGLRGRVGVGRELSDGALLRTWNLVTSVATHVHIGRVQVLAGIYNDARVYNDRPPTDWSDLHDIRFDDRLTPFGRARVEVWDYLGVYAGYAYSNNLSTHDENLTPRAGLSRPHLDRTYQRHFIELGVEGRL